MGVAFALSLLTLDTVEIHFFFLFQILDDLKIRKAFFLECFPKGFRKLEMNIDSLK